jgi:hypothetical protein
MYDFTKEIECGMGGMLIANIVWGYKIGLLKLICM